MPLSFSLGHGGGGRPRAGAVGASTPNSSPLLLSVAINWAEPSSKPGAEEEEEAWELPPPVWGV